MAANGRNSGDASRSCYFLDESIQSITPHFNQHIYFKPICLRYMERVIPRACPGNKLQHKQHKTQSKAFDKDRIQSAALQFKVNERGNQNLGLFFGIKELSTGNVFRPDAKTNPSQN